jgi:hypothetical protein
MDVISLISLIGKESGEGNPPAKEIISGFFKSLSISLMADLFIDFAEVDSFLFISGNILFIDLCKLFKCVIIQFSNYWDHKQ